MERWKEWKERETSVQVVLNTRELFLSTKSRETRDQVLFFCFSFSTSSVREEVSATLNWLFSIFSPLLHDLYFLVHILSLDYFSPSSPGEQAVSGKINVDWGSYLASRRDFIYARVDVRGSRNYGDRTLQETWHKLGSIEVDDYVKVMSYLKNDLSFVDPKRTAIWGTSYGGYVASLAVAHERNSFNCAIAVAPITNWLFVGESVYP